MFLIREKYRKGMKVVQSLSNMKCNLKALVPVQHDVFTSILPCDPNYMILEEHSLHRMNTQSIFSLKS